MFATLIIIGLLIGSFLNVLIYRIPRKLQFHSGRSFCPKCKKNLKARDLVPLFSWIINRGTCRFCNSGINIRYPIIELITGVTFYLSSIKINTISYEIEDNLIIIFSCILVSFLIVITFIDIDFLIIPYKLSIPCIITGFLWTVLIIYLGPEKNNFGLLINHLLASVTGYFSFYLFSQLISILIKKPGLGLGDAKLAALSGAWMGFSGIELVTVISILFAGLISTVLLFTKLVKKGQYIPFAPFMSISIFLVWLLGNDFWINKLGTILWWRYL